MISRLPGSRFKRNFGCVGQGLSGAVDSAQVFDELANQFLFLFGESAPAQNVLRDVVLAKSPPPPSPPQTAHPRPLRTKDRTKVSRPSTGAKSPRTETWRRLVVLAG